MSDMSHTVDTPNLYDGDYPREMYDRAFHLWTTTGRNASRVERILTAQAIASTPDGGQVPPVPATGTILDWAREDHWEDRFLRKLLDDLPAMTLTLHVELMTLAVGAVDALHDCRSGRYDTDPKLRAAVERGAHDTLKLVGIGTAGANQGGLWTPSATEILKALGHRDDTAQELPESETSRNNREAIAASKRGRE